MRIGIDMGHSLSGTGTGAIGIKSEVEMNRLVGKRLIIMLQEKGHTVVNCTVDYADSTNSQLAGIVNKANATTLDVFCSLHLNSFNGQAHGVETYIYSGVWAGKEANRQIAQKVQNQLVSKVGWYNRGVKEADYYVLKGTVAPAILVEMGFCDSKVDMDKWNTETIAKAIFEGLTGSAYDGTSQPSQPSSCDAEIKRYSENGKFTTTVDSIYFRDKPCTCHGEIQDSYYKNESVYYDLVVITNSYVWISWVGVNGARRYIPITDRKTNEKWGYCV